MSQKCKSQWFYQKTVLRYIQCKYNKNLYHIWYTRKNEFTPYAEHDKLRKYIEKIDKKGLEWKGINQQTNIDRSFDRLFSHSPEPIWSCFGINPAGNGSPKARSRPQVWGLKMVVRQEMGRWIDATVSPDCEGSRSALSCQGSYAPLSFDAAAALWHLLSFLSSVSHYLAT